MNIQEFIEKHDLIIKSEESKFNFFNPVCVGCRHWKSTIYTNKDRRRRITIYYSIEGEDSPEPTLKEVLETIVKNSKGVLVKDPFKRFVIDVYNFEQWCSKYKYNRDSMKSLSLYNSTITNIKAFTRFFDDESFQELFNCKVGENEVS